jgi:3-phenylpropionate/trans-cinnamate dioxygenase ferredoxin subunit
MEYIIASVKDIPPGKMISISHQGKNILVANFDGKFYAIGNSCTHLGCFLSAGVLNGEKVECPCKGSVFDIKTGEVLKGPAVVPEPTYKLAVEEDQVILIV